MAKIYTNNAYTYIDTIRDTTFPNSKNIIDYYR